MSEDHAIIFGSNAVLEKLKANPQDVVEVLLGGDAGAAVEAEARRLGLRVSRVSRAFLDRLTERARHQGVAARVAAFAYRPLADLLDGVALTAPRRVLLLDEITDPRNFGALLRSADGAGVADVIIPKDRAASVTPVVIKSSAGAAYHMNVYRVTNLRQAMGQLKEIGFWLVGLDATAEASIYEKAYPERLGIVLGSEGRGLRPLVRRECDFLVSIPMFGKVGSLNVAVAGAVFLYEIRRREAHTDIDKEGGKR